MRGYARVYHVLESLQYGLLYMFAAFFGGVGLDFLFPRYSDNTPTGPLFGQVIGQCSLLVLVVYFVRFVIKQVPILFPVYPGSKYVPYQVPEYEGEMMMGLIFLGSQLNLVQKIDLLAQRFYEYLFNEKRDLVGESVDLRAKVSDEVRKAKDGVHKIEEDVKEIRELRIREE